MLLVSPDGQNATIMSDAGGSTDLVNCTLTLDDEAATALPDTTRDRVPGELQAGRLRARRPVPGAGTDPERKRGALDLRRGTANGTWSLYIVDDAGIDFGNLGGWSLNVTGSGPPPPPPPPPAAATAATSAATRLGERRSAVPGPLRSGRGLGRHIRVRVRWLLVHGRGNVEHGPALQPSDRCVDDADADPDQGDRGVCGLLPADEQDLRLRRLAA